MVKEMVDMLLELVQVSVVHHEPILVQVFSGQHHLNHIVVAMQPGALMALGQMIQLVAGRKSKLLRNDVHVALPSMRQGCC